MTAINWCGVAVIVLSAVVVACGGVAIGLLGIFVGALTAALDWERL